MLIFEEEVLIKGIMNSTIYSDGPSTQFVIDPTTTIRQNLIKLTEVIIKNAYGDGLNNGYNAGYDAGIETPPQC